MNRNSSRHTRKYSYQNLEPRQLLASIGSENGEVLVRGTATADEIELVGELHFRSFTIRINSDANLTQTFQYSEVSKLTVFAGVGTIA